MDPEPLRAPRIAAPAGHGGVAAGGARGAADAGLRQRIKRIVLTVPVPLPRFWLAALASLDEPVDLGAELPDYYAQGAV